MSYLTTAMHRDYFVDERFFSDSKSVAFLSKKGIRLHPISLDSRLYEGISGHSDIVGCPVFLTTVIEREVYDHHRFDLREFDITLGQSSLARDYPYDVRYNVAIFGKTAIHSKYIDSVIKEQLTKFKVESIVVKQGYAKCSIVVVDEKSIITSDIGIYRACKEKLDVCLVSVWKDIFLWGMEYGLLGGTSLTRGREIYFTGDISKHPDYWKMKNFANQKGISLLSMSEGRLVDVGGFLTLYLRTKDNSM